MELYKTVKENSVYTGEITEKKSRFIGYLSFASAKEEADSFLLSIRKKHYDAKHNCSAYIIAGENGAPDTGHSSDDGEPSGTAGKPIMTVLNGAGLKNVVLVVTRYFGGVLLGTGGLARAYTEAAKAAVENAKDHIVTMGDFNMISVTFDYASEGTVRRLLDRYGIFPLDTEYGEKVTFRVSIPTEKSDEFNVTLRESLSGAFSLRDEGELILPVR